MGIYTYSCTMCVCVCLAASQNWLRGSTNQLCNLLKKIPRYLGAEFAYRSTPLLHTAKTYEGLPQTCIDAHKEVTAGKLNWGKNPKKVKGIILILTFFC